MQSRLQATSSRVKDTGIRYSVRLFAPYVFLQWHTTASLLTALVTRPGNVKTFLFFLQYPITRVLNKHSKIKWRQNHMVSSDYRLGEKKNHSRFCSVLQMVLMDSMMQSHIFIAEENAKTILKIYLWNIVLLLDTRIGNQRVPLKSCHFYSIFCSTCIIWWCKHLSKWKNYLLTNALLDPALKTPFPFITFISVPRILISTCKTEIIVTWPFCASESMVILSS